MDNVSIEINELNIVYILHLVTSYIYLKTRKTLKGFNNYVYFVKFQNSKIYDIRNSKTQSRFSPSFKVRV